MFYLLNKLQRLISSVVEKRDMEIQTDGWTNSYIRRLPYALGSAHRGINTQHKFLILCLMDAVFKFHCFGFKTIINDAIMCHLNVSKLEFYKLYF